MPEHDLFVSLSHNRFAETLSELEIVVTHRIATRHKYPIWPHGNQPLDDYDEAIHGPSREIYYSSTLLLIRVLRKLRELA